MDSPRINYAQSDVIAHGPAYILVLWLLTTEFVWAFAFMGMPEASPEWLVRARAVCFGINETGLPDARGWLLLALAPLSFLVAIIVTYGGRELMQGLLSASQSFSRQLFFVALVILTVFQIDYVATRISRGLLVRRAQQEITLDESRLPAGYPQLMRAAPDFNLLNQHHERVSIESLKGETVFLSFVFAHCQTVCPIISRTLKGAVKELGPEKTRIVFVTLDPRRDTPSSLLRIAKQWELGERDMILSGDVAAVEKVLQDYNTGAVRDDKTGDVLHPPLVYVVDGQGILRYAFTNPQTNWLVDAVRNII